MIYRQLIPRRVRSNWRIALILGALGLTVQYFKGRHIDAVIIAEIGVSLILAAAFGLARASTVRLSYREGQWWSQGTWLTAVLWIVSVAAHLGFDYVVAGHNRNGFGSATLLLYLAVTFSMQRLLVQARVQRAAIPAQAGQASFA